MDSLTTLQIVNLVVTNYVLIGTWFFILDISRIEEKYGLVYKEFVISAIFWPGVFVLAILVALIEFMKWIKGCFFQSHRL